MGSRTNIEWTDATWTPIRARNRATGKVGWHCEHVSPGCEHCYSEAVNARRLGTRLPFKPGHRADVEIFLDEAMLLNPLRWTRPRRIFVCSMTDLFGEFVPDAMIDRVFAVMALAPQHTFQVLTKRSARMRAYCGDLRTPGRIARVLVDEVLIADRWPHDPDTWPVESIGDIDLPDDITVVWPLPNVWLGVSTEDQRRADERVPDLLATPAAVRFVSAEPLLGPIDFTSIYDPDTGSAEPWPHQVDALTGDVSDEANGIIPGVFPPGEAPRLDWIIVGGESGVGARATHPAWARAVRDACTAAGVEFCFKQWGAWQPRAWCRDGGTHAMRWSGQISFQKIQSHPDSIERVGAGDEWSAFALVGKRAAGRLLDGVEHNGIPGGQP